MQFNYKTEYFHSIGSVKLNESEGPTWLINDTITAQTGTGLETEKKLKR
jgi:hypothetical protein